ncbi:MAG: polysulfide reductase NrfD [Candidatus Latescibacteria bacterium]|nr:polysulfide reductase NrfD [Candidatus Latescibacterota bacterium]MBT5830014.1 polysulfide reductase NrfD [Candidatus Latescibacterota bacterium]
MASTAPEKEDPTAPAPVLGPGQTYTTVTQKISSIITSRTPLGWIIGVALALGLMQCFALGVTWLLIKGVGVWGLNVPVGWGWAIINFVWWIGIGHAGTLISAILLLMRQNWRNSINRFAEAMTIFAVICAMQFPLLHTGRPWIAAYWLLPYPNSMGVWPQFRSPLIWDVFAVSTYFTVSLIFWYIGLIPDFATLRDKAKQKVSRVIYGILSMGWRGSAKHWHNYEMTSLLLAGISTPLVLSVHSIVSFDFSVGLVPGWHATIFPPYFVAGAVFAGFAMVLTLALPLRAVYGLHDFITDRHLNNMSKVMLATGLIVAYGYGMEQFYAWYSASTYEGYMMQNRTWGPYSFEYWMLILCNVAVPQLLWIKWVRLNPIMLFIVSMFINVGMWLERFIIVVTSLHRDYMPSSWDMYRSTPWDWLLYIGTIGIFLLGMLLFIRVMPVINIVEIRLLVPRKGHDKKPDHDASADASAD